MVVAVQSTNWKRVQDPKYCFLTFMIFYSALMKAWKYFSIYLLLDKSCWLLNNWESMYILFLNGFFFPFLNSIPVVSKLAVVFKKKWSLSRNIITMMGHCCLRNLHPQQKWHILLANRSKVQTTYKHGQVKLMHMKTNENNI